MNALLTMIENTVEDLWGHVHRVSSVAVQIGRTLGIGPDLLDNLSAVGVLHDIGKVHIDPVILAKPGPLTDAEIREIRRHPELGFAMTAGLIAPEICEGILHHHERWDGNGYPDGLAGERIPILSRIVLVADAYDAMTSLRSYQPAIPRELAVAEIVDNAGTQFDPAVVEAFLIANRGTARRLTGVAAR